MADKRNEFFDMGALDELDKQIAERMARPTLVKKLKEKKKAASKVEGLNWKKEMEEYWYVYLFLAISAMFTGTLGIYMGLSPKLLPEQNVIFYNTDIPHIILALVYFIAFIGVTELAFAIMKWKFHTREENNGTQQWTMITGMGVSGLSILATGIAGGTVIASNITFLTDFASVPDAAQKWVVIAIPVLITTYTFLLSAYALSSESAQSERLTREQERENELDHRTRLKSIEQIGAQQLQVAEIRRYQQLVLAGKISAAEAAAAIRAGRTLNQEETRQSRDIDGDNIVGGSRTQFYDMDAFLAAVGMTREQAVAKWKGKEYKDFAGEISQKLDIRGENMRQLFGELFPQAQGVSNNGRR